MKPWTKQEFCLNLIICGVNKFKSGKTLHFKFPTHQIGAGIKPYTDTETPLFDIRRQGYQPTNHNDSVDVNCINEQQYNKNNKIWYFEYT